MAGFHEDLHAATQVPAQLVGSAAAYGDGGLVGVGLMVALRMSSARAFPGPPARVLPRRLLSSPARCLPEVLWSSLAGIPPRVVVFLVCI